MSAGLQWAVVVPLLWALWIAIADFSHKRIPNLLLLAALIPSLIWLLWKGQSPLGANWFDAATGLFAGFFLTLPGYISARLGAGDVKLAAVLGLMQGLHGLLFTLLLGALLLGAASLIVIYRLGREDARTQTLPAGAALCGAFALNLSALPWLM